MCGSNGPATIDRSTLTMNTLLSSTDEKSIDRAPDYADLASTKPLPHKGSSINIGIISRSA
jgi:hypothetical protein